VGTLLPSTASALITLEVHDTDGYADEQVVDLVKPPIDGKHALASLSMFLRQVSRWPDGREIPSVDQIERSPARGTLAG
jgi:hypothetical protein